MSGILYSQRNDIVNYYSKFNLKLLKSTYIEGWISLILKNMQLINDNLKTLISLKSRLLFYFN